MTFYGIVDSITEESGSYGRNNLVSKILKKFPRNISRPIKFIYYALKNSPIIKVASFKDSLNGPYINNDTKINLGPFFLESQCKVIHIHNDLLAENYNIDNEKFLLKLFKSSKQFETIMKYQGGSTLYIYERSNLPCHLKHYNGDIGKFEQGLYCEHPKNRDILIPLKNYANIIQNLISKEISAIFGLLGLKKFTIRDITNINMSSKTEVIYIDTSIDAKLSYKKEMIWESEFGIRPRDIYHKKINTMYFVPDFPDIMDIINSRIYENLLKRTFKKTINLDIGLDINIIKLFNSDTNFEYSRTWSFDIEFYDKSLLNSQNSNYSFDLTQLFVSLSNLLMVLIKLFYFYYQIFLLFY